MADEALKTIAQLLREGQGEFDLSKRLRELRIKAEAVLSVGCTITQIGKRGFWYRPAGETFARIFQEWGEKTQKANEEIF